MFVHTKILNKFLLWYHHAPWEKFMLFFHFMKWFKNSELVSLFWLDSFELNFISILNSGFIFIQRILIFNVFQLFFFSIYSICYRVFSGWKIPLLSCVCQSVRPYQHTILNNNEISSFDLVSSLECVLYNLRTWTK